MVELASIYSSSFYFSRVSFHLIFTTGLCLISEMPDRILEHGHHDSDIVGVCSGRWLIILKVVFFKDPGTRKMFYDMSSKRGSKDDYYVSVELPTKANVNVLLC